MTDDPTPIWASAKAAFLAVPVLGTALCGGLGGATNALVIKVTALEALRHVAIGATFAAALGGLGAPLVGHWLGLQPGTLNVPEGAAGGTVAYLTVCSLRFCSSRYFPGGAKARFAAAGNADVANLSDQAQGQPPR